MTQGTSGGYRLFSFREGDRSEYLAIYALTRIAFVTPVPRQEDFGIIDFRCVLTQKRGNDVVPSGTFCVQVKSEVAELVFERSKVRWISTNMDSPLFICAIDKKGSHINIFSCINIWSALFLRADPLSITLIPNKVRPNDQAYVHHPGTTGDEATDREGRFDVYLGPPVVSMPLDEFDQKSEQVFSILDAWIRLDRVNVALMRLGRAAALECEPTQPNHPSIDVRLRTFNRTVNQHGLIDKICPLLESLQQSYAKCGSASRAAEIQTLMQDLRGDVDAEVQSGIERRSALARLLE